ncbi:benzoate-CoA ligase family protein [Marinobacter sp.]|uniref:benzoate-CoA ligase family protein n=1 Tax=Marinobacter sp. TaxID=50741 RepID=UPI00384BDB6A
MNHNALIREPREDLLPREFNAVSYFIDRHLEEGRGNRLAVIDSKGETTYEQLAEQVNRAANMYRDLGLRQEMRVALAMLDTADYFSCFWGALKAGVVPICLNTLLTPPQYRYVLEDSRPSVLIVDRLLYPLFAELINEVPSIEHVIIVGGGEQNLPALSSLLEQASKQAETTVTTRDDTAFWLYSSGSTGKPKGVRHRHANLYWCAELYGRGVLGITEDDRIFSIAKLFFAYGMGNGMTFPLSVGATSILFDGRPSATATLDIMEQHQPTIFCGVPTLYAALLGDKSLESRPGSIALRCSISAGEALPGEVGRRWEERFGSPIMDGVGSTEMLHIFLSNQPNDIHYGCSGRAVPGYKLRLVDFEGRDICDGEIGELLVKGPSAAEGYWNQREKNLKTFVGEWTYTGDKYYRDEQGLYHYCGRSDDMFKSGGNWVSPFEVESALVQNPNVLEAAVIARADASGNLKPMAYVVLKDGGLGDEVMKKQLQDFVREQIELWKYPRWIEFVDELPKTATGKIQRFKLRDAQRDLAS